MADERLLAFLAELERADEEVAATLAELDELARDVDGVRVRASELDRRLTELPAERERLVSARAEADRLVEARREALGNAEDALSEARRAGDERRTASAKNEAVRAGDALHMAERSAVELAGQNARLEAEAEAAAGEAEGLGRRARVLAEGLASRPRLATEVGSPPGDTLQAVAEWAGTARAALFVARGSLASERDAVIRQANELGALVLGEPVTAGSTADVARRIKRAGR